MHANGEGVLEGHVLAYMWWNLAAAQGDENVESNKVRAEQRMTRAQIAEAQRLSREWIEAPGTGSQSHVLGRSEIGSTLVPFTSGNVPYGTEVIPDNSGMKRHR